MCFFCANFDFGVVGICSVFGTERICLANGTTAFTKDEQFKYCPLCGEKLDKNRQDNPYTLLKQSEGIAYGKTVKKEKTLHEFVNVVQQYKEEKQKTIFQESSNIEKDMQQLAVQCIDMIEHFNRTLEE